jgi:hypothetical protein
MPDQGTEIQEQEKGEKWKGKRKYKKINDLGL